MAKTTIHSDYIPDNAITSTKIAENSIGAREIATNAITTLYVADGSVTTVKIADDAITSAKLDTNIDIAGTFDVTGATTLDSGLTVDTTTLVVDASNNRVGIGNTSPLGKLTISNAAGNNAPNTITAANTYLQLGSDDYGPNNDGKFMIGFGYTDATNTNSPAYIGYEETSTSGDTKGELTFYTRDVITDTAPTERMRIDSSGNVGIGTSSPSKNLSIFNSSSAWNQYATLRLATETEGTYYGEVSFHRGTSDESDRGLVFNVGGTEKMRILNSNGNVGIGTDNPGERLEVDGVVEINRTGNHPAIRFSESDTVRAYMGSGDWAINGGNDDDFGISSSGTGDLLLGTTAGVERMRIDSSGRVGIGCTPTGFATEIQATSGGNALKLRGRSAAENAGWLAWTDNADNVEAAMYATANNLIFANTTSYTERMRIDSSGNVGIGTDSPNSWASYTDSAATVLQVEDSSQRARIIINGGNGAHLDLVDYAGSANDKHMNIAVDAGILKFGSLNDAGSAFVQNNIMTMDLGTGNVGIGTNSPSTGLHVVTAGGTTPFRVQGGANSGVNIMEVGYAGGGAGANFLVDDNGFAHVGGKDVAHKGLSVKYHAANDSYTPTAFNDYSLLRLNVANAEGNYAGITYTHNGGTEFFTGLVRVGATSDITDYIFQGYNGNSNAYQEYMRIHSGGQVTIPHQPAFRVYLSTEQTSNGVVTTGFTDSNSTASRAYDENGDFNTSNGRFTAPVAGVYVFSIMWDSNGSQAGFDVLINGTEHARWEPTGRTDDVWESKAYSTHAKLAANDYVQLKIVHASGSYPVHQGGGIWGHWAGALIS